MKMKLRTLVLCLVTLFAASNALYAGSIPPKPAGAPPAPPPGPTTALVYSGYLSLAASGNFYYSLFNQGITTSFPNSVTTPDQHQVSPIHNGFLDVNTGLGEIQADGGITFTSGTSELRLRQIAFESVGNGIFLTASVVVNGIYQGRSPVFQVSSPNPVTSPLALGEVMSGDLFFALDPTFSATLTNYFQIPAATPGETVGTVSFDVNLVAGD